MFRKLAHPIPLVSWNATALVAHSSGRLGKTTACTRSPWGSAWRWWIRWATRAMWPWPSAMGPFLSSGTSRAETARRWLRRVQLSPGSPSAMIWSRSGGFCAEPLAAMPGTTITRTCWKCPALRSWVWEGPGGHWSLVTHWEQQPRCTKKWNLSSVPWMILDYWTGFT